MGTSDVLVLQPWTPAPKFLRGFLGRRPMILWRWVGVFVYEKELYEANEEADEMTAQASAVQRKVYVRQRSRTVLSFRAKLFILFTATVLTAVGLFAWGVTRYNRQTFAEWGAQRSDALVAQFRTEYAQRGNAVVESVESIAEAEGTVRMALDLTRPQADPSLYARDAAGLATAHHLDFLEFATDDGTLMSSAQWPARVGYRNDWVTTEKNWNEQGAFLSRVDSPDNVVLATLAVRVVHVGEKNFYVIGGRQLDATFLRSIAPPAGTRTLLYRNLEAGFVPGAIFDANGPVPDADRFAPVIESIQNQPRSSDRATAERPIEWTPGHAINGAQGTGAADAATNSPPEHAEAFTALPLTGRHNELLAVVLVGSSQGELGAFNGYIRYLALLIAAAGIGIGIILSWWVSARVTRPLLEVGSGVRAVAEGNWDARVAATSDDEFGTLARTFNDMTQRLPGERERLVQAERVMAWREVARRLANELKEPLFPLQVTIESLEQARRDGPGQFDEVFAESVAALRSELQALRGIAARFRDFAKMPEPRLQPVSVNDAIRAAMKRFEPRFSGIGRPPVMPELFLDDGIATINADEGWFNKALENLLITLLDAMPGGGALIIRTLQKGAVVRIELSNSGTGLNSESVVRMFTPYDASRQAEAGEEAGLGLATVLSVVTDHGGKVRVDSAPGAGTTFRIDFPAGSRTVAPRATVAAATVAVTPPLAAPIEPPVATEDSGAAASEFAPRSDLASSSAGVAAEISSAESSSTLSEALAESEGPQPPVPVTDIRSRQLS